MRIRIFWSVVVSMFFGGINCFLNVAAPPILGSASVKQLEDSNISYASSQFIMRALDGSSISWIVLFGVLLAIWWKPLLKVVRNPKVVTLTLILAFSMTVMPIPAHAGQDTEDKPEFVEVKSNQSAFVIPLQGANKQTQGKFMSQAFLEENKVATKRISIPHMLIHNPGLNRNQYVPAVKVILVDRTSYYREWVDASDRGTSNKKEGFTCESNESLNIGVGVAIGAKVKEENAAKFLYNFGTQNNNEAFATVDNGFGLNQIMDGVVRGRVGASICQQLGDRPLLDDIRQKTKIMATVEADTRKYCEERGITLEYLGYATPLNFDERIQKSIDKVFITNMDAQAYDALSKMMPLYQQQADMHIKEGVATALQTRGFPTLPSFMVMSDKLLDTIMGWFGGTKAAPAKR